MTWVPPLGDAVNFEEAVSWTAPAGDAVDVVEGFTGEEFARLFLAVTVADSTRVELPIEVLIGPMVELPLAVSVVDSSAPLELPLRVTVSIPGTVTLAIGLEVIDADAVGGLDGAAGWAAAPDGQWRAVVTLDGADISARIVGQITVTHADDAAAVAELSYLPLAALQPLSLIGRPVRIAFARADGSSRQAMFAGVVDVPQIDLATGVITLRCHDQAQEVWSRTPRETIAALVGGRYSAALVGDEPEDNLEYLRERIQSVGASWAIDVLGRVRVIPWGTTDKAITVRTADVLDGSLSVDLPSREQIRTRITCRLQYRYTRLRQRFALAQLVLPVSFFIYSRVFKLYMRQPLLRAMVMDAVEHVSSWKLQGDVVTEHMRAGPYQAADLSNAPAIIITPDVAQEYLLSFSARYATRWKQSITEDYTISVVWPALEAQIGASVPEDAGASIESKFDADGWDNDWSVAPSLGDASNEISLDWESDGAAKSDRDEALRALLDRAWVRLWSASRSGRVKFDVPLRPDLWLDTRVTLDHARVRAAGKISEVTHVMDTVTGAAVSTVTLAVGMPGATADALPAWTLPASPQHDFSPPLSAYSFELGAFVGGEPDSPPFDEATMIGFTTNGVNFYNDQEGAGINWYPHQLSMRAPDIAAEDRDPLTLTTSAQIDVAVPTDLLEILAP